MPLGDSITRGEGTSASLIPGGYRDPLAHELATADISFQFVGDWDSNATDFLTSAGDTGHSGHGGWRIDQIQNNITNWQEAFTPDVVLLHIGTNDILQGADLGTGGFDTSKAVARLNTLLNTIYSNNSHVSVVLSTIIPVADGRDGYVKNYNSLIASTVVPHFTNLGRSIILADNYKNFVNISGGYRTDLYSDGIIHPNAAGYQKMADTWFSSVQNIPVPPDQPPLHPAPTTLRFTSLVIGGSTGFDSHIRENLVSNGSPSLDTMTVSHDPSIPGTFKTTGLNDGAATSNSNLTYYATNEPSGTLPTVVTFSLKGSPAGYDITRVESLAGWKDSNIGDQKFRLLLSITGGEFLDYGTYSATGELGDFSSLITVTDESGIIATGVTAIRIIFLNPNATQGGSGGTVIRELQVFGTATAVPEPSSTALLNLGVAGSLGVLFLNYSKSRKKNKAPAFDFSGQQTLPHVTDT